MHEQAGFLPTYSVGQIEAFGWTKLPDVYPFDWKFESLGYELHYLPYMKTVIVGKIGTTQYFERVAADGVAEYGVHLNGAYSGPESELPTILRTIFKSIYGSEWLPSSGHY